MRRELLGLLALLAPGFGTFAETPNAKASAFIKGFGFTDAEIASVAAGKVVTRDLATKDDNDVAVVGAARIGAPEGRLAENRAQLEVFLKEGPVVELGRFDSPPRIDDLAGLTLDPQDLRASQRCRPGNCDFQLGTAAMESVRKVDWTSRQGGAAFVGLLKEAMIDDLVSYQRDGRMAVYVDNEVPESVAAALQKSLADSPYLPLDSPFMRYLVEYPNAALPDTEDIFYWTKEKVRDPVISVHHLIVHKGGDGETTDYTIADKHIADNHYFLAAVELVWLLDDSGAKPGFYGVRLNRTRIDPPREFRGLLLGRIRKAMRKTMYQSLTETKASLEAIAP